MNFFNRVKTRVFAGLFVLSLFFTTFLPVASANGLFVGPQVSAWTVEYRVKRAESIDAIFNGTIPTGHALIVIRNPRGDVEYTTAYWKDYKKRPLKINSGSDRDIANGDCGPRGCAIRQAKVSKKRARWIGTMSNNFKEPYFIGGVYPGLNCVTYANRVWSMVTAGQENFHATVPNKQADTLERMGKLFNRGIVWP